MPENRSLRTALGLSPSARGVTPPRPGPNDLAAIMLTLARIEARLTAIETTLAELVPPEPAQAPFSTERLDGP